MVLSKAALLSVAASPATAFFLVPQWPLVVDRLDPIVNPNELAKHVHHIVGGSGFQPSMDYNTTQQSKCTTSMVSADLSNYWVPQLYIQRGDGSFEIVPAHGSMSTYYLNEKTRLGSGEEMKAFPAGFRMLAGDPDRTSDDGTMPKGAINFKCLNYGGKPTDFDTIPQGQSCPDGIRSEITFPSCWDGENLDSEDHRSHVAYPTIDKENGACPSSHPVHLVVLKSEQIWDTSKFEGQGKFVFANGDPEGYGYHGDFVMGWKEGFLQRAVDECQSTTGEIEACSVFDGLINRQYLDPKTCEVEAKVEEEVKGPLQALPGCNPITSGPQRRKRDSCNDQVQIKAGWSDATGGFGAVGDAISDGIDAVTSAIGGIFPGADQSASPSAPSVAPAQFFEKPAEPAPEAPAVNGGKKIVTEWVTATETTTVTGSAPTAGSGWVDNKKRDVAEHVHKHRNAHRRGSF